MKKQRSLKKKFEATPVMAALFLSGCAGGKMTPVEIGEVYRTAEEVIVPLASWDAEEKKWRRTGGPSRLPSGVYIVLE